MPGERMSPWLLCYWKIEWDSSFYYQTPSISLMVVLSYSDVNIQFLHDWNLNNESNYEVLPHTLLGLLCNLGMKALLFPQRANSKSRIKYNKKAYSFLLGTYHNGGATEKNTDMEWAHMSREEKFSHHFPLPLPVLKNLED